MKTSPRSGCGLSKVRVCLNGGRFTLLAVIGVIAALLLCPTLGASAATLTEVNSGIPEFETSGAAWGDFDNDGDLDVLFPGLNFSPRLYENIGGVFVEATNRVVWQGESYSDGAWADWDGDGDLDFVMSSAVDEVLRFYRNMDGVFVVSSTLPFFMVFSELAWGDADNDGDLDLFSSGHGALIRKIGGSFAWDGLGLTPVAYAGSATWSDFDGDGDLDITIAGDSGVGVVSKVYRNRGKRQFEDTGIVLPGAGDRRVAWADCDNDGDDDLVVAGIGGTQLFRNIGAGLLVESGISLPATGYGSVALGDFDADGWVDLAIAGLTETSSTRVLRNVGGTNFVDTGIDLVPVQGGTLAWGDYDKDGDLDLLIVGFQPDWVTPVIKLYRNDGAPNPPPSAPVAGVAAVRGNSVALDWLPASDSNQSGGLTYNLKVWNTSNGMAVMSPMSDDTTGLRRLPTPGNARHRLGWTLTNLPPSAAPYAWSVQAVDHGFAGSAFSTGSTFRIHFPPVIAPPTNRFAPAGRQPFCFPFTVTDPDTAAPQITVTATSSNQVVVSNASMELIGADTNRSLCVRSALGTTRITLVAADPEAGQTNVSFEVTFTNAPPFITGVPNINVPVNHPVPAIHFQVGDLLSSAESLQVESRSSNPALVSNAGLMLSGEGTNRTLSITPVPNQTGIATISLTIADEHGASNSVAFALTVGVFADAAISLPYLSLGTCNWIDYDSDGDLDIFGAGASNAIPVTLLFRNDGGAFTGVAAGLPGLMNAAAFWEDYNGDGRMDVLLTGRTGTENFTQLFRNTGNPAAPFVASGIALPALNNGSADWGDYDNDGFVDFWLSGVTTGLTNISRLYRNNRDGTFSAVEAGFRVAESETGAWGDADNDGDLDLLLRGNVSFSTSFASVYRNNGDGTFTELSNSLQSISRGKCAWADFDRDGDLDVLLSGSSASRSYRNNGTGLFSPAFTFPAASELAVGDFDHDGLPDVLQGGNSWPTLLFRNTGSGFSQAASGLPASLPQVLAWGDFDNDGDLDALVLDSLASPSSWRIFRNELPPANTPPQAPSQLSAMAVDQVSTILAWNRPEDPPHTNRSLTYNLRFGRTPGGSEVASPGADPATGYLWFPTQGRIGPTNRWRLDDLPAGTYFWSVQAVDAGLLGSAFSVESSFVISNSRPRLSPLTNLATSHGVPVEIPLIVSDSESSAASLQLTATSGNTNLIAPFNLLFSGTGSNRSLRIIPTLDRVSTSAIPITVTVTDPGGYFATRAFTIRVTNASPVLALSTDAMSPGTFPTLIVPAGTAEVTVPFRIGDLETPATRLLITTLLNNTNLSVAGGIALGGFVTNRTMILRLNTNALGETRIAVRVADSLGAAATNTFILRVVLPAPIISEVSDITLAPGAPVPPVNFSIYDPATPAADLIVRVTATSPLVESNGILVSRTGTNWTLQLAPVPELTGVSRIEITVSNALQQTSRRAFYLRVEPLNISLDAIPRLNHGGVAWGDYDNDGWLDLALTGSDSNFIPFTGVYRNNGDGTLSNITARLPSIAAGVASWGDYNNDGRLDLLLHSDYDERLTADVFRNEGSNVFTPVLAGIRNPSGGRAGWVDFDNDGDLDVWSAGSGGFFGSALLFYRNDGADLFTLVNPGLPPLSSVLAAAWGDYDNDGDSDLLLSGRRPNLTSLTFLFRNDGRGRFFEQNAGLSNPLSRAAWADFDGDGWLDLALAGEPATNQIETPAAPPPPSSTRLYRNRRDGGFTFVGVAMPDLTAAQGTLAWADYDNNGKPDLLIAGHSSSGRISKLFLNTGDFAFPELLLGLTPAGDTYSAFGDVDRDGDLDLLLNGGPAGWIALHTNTLATVNTPPSAPYDLDSFRAGDGAMILRWNPSLDPESGARHLTYNLRVGTTPGGEEVASPQADLVTGLRRVAAPGNAGITNQWRMRLPPGTYFWSVQAVDAGFAASLFSNEATFTVTNVAPVAGAQTVTIMEDTPYEFLLGATEADYQSLAFSIRTAPAHGTLFGIPPIVIYLPDTNYFGTDSFTFQVADGLVTSAPATVSLNILPQPDAVPVRLAAFRDAGGVRLQLEGEPYQSYQLETSANLMQWQERAVLQIGSGASAVFIDADAGGSVRFYRARLLDR